MAVVTSDNMANIRILKLSEPPCEKSRGRWQKVVGDLAVCDACDDPARTCYTLINPEARADDPGSGADNVAQGQRMPTAVRAP